jgi:hypothetical protein
LKSNRWIFVIRVLVAMAGRVSAQPIVLTGTGYPIIDIPAVQAAVDPGGQVILMGQILFRGRAEHTCRQDL